MQTTSHSHPHTQVRVLPRMFLFIQTLSVFVLFQGYEEDIERLRRDLQAARDKNGVYIAAENYE